MTRTQKDIIAKLLAGYYIVVSHGREVLYRDNAIPVMRMRWYDMKKIRPWLKKDRKGRQTINLSTIRQLHGNHVAKRLYRKKIDITPLQNPPPKKKKKTGACSGSTNALLIF